MKKRITPTLIVSALVASLLVTPVAAGGGYHHNKINVIMPDDLSLDASSWYFFDDVAKTSSTVEVDGKYKFVEGEGSPAGKGSLKFDAAAGESWSLATKQYNDVKLSELKKLSYYGYQPDTNVGVDSAMHVAFDVDFDGVEGTGADDGRLVYLPRNNGEVMLNQWQKWSATSDEAMWTWSGFAANSNQWQDGNTSQTRSWAEIKAAFPNATMSADTGDGQLLFGAGEPYADPFTGYLDKLTIRTAGERKMAFDLEPSLTAAVEADCRDGNWRRWNDPQFYSEDHCLKFLGIYDHDHSKKWGWWWHWNHDGDRDRWDKWFQNRERPMDSSWEN